MMNNRYATLGCLSAPAFFPFVFLVLLFSGVASAQTLVFETSGGPESASLDSSGNGAAGIAVNQANPLVSSPSPASANSELFFMIEELQQQVKSLRGLIEEQSNEIRHLKRNAKTRYLDLDSRMQVIAKKQSMQAPVTSNHSAMSREEGGKDQLDAGQAPVKHVGQGIDPDVSKTAVVTPEEKKAYQEAYALIKAKKFDESVVKFYEFIEKYPNSSLAGNAYYWLGEVYLVLPKLEQARQAFSIVIQAYPDHSKAADSLFKLGVAYDRLQNPTESQKYLTEVQKRFPDSTAAKLAKSYKINR